MRPGRTLFIAALCLLFLGAATFFSPVFLRVWRMCCFGLLALALIDGLVLVCWTDRLAVRRKIATSLSLGAPVVVTLSITRSAPEAAASTERRKKRAGLKILPRHFTIFDLYDDSMRVNHRDFTTFKADGGQSSLGSWIFSYEAMPVRRGKWEFSGCELLISSMLRFWRLKVVHGAKSFGKTYPDFSKLARQDDLQAVLHQVGLKNVRKRGLGLEFESLREWQNGDSVRAIDWRATSRLKKGGAASPTLIVRQYQEEQDQQVLFLLDSGYRLHRFDGELSAANAQSELRGVAGAPVTQFDYALNACLLLAWTALKHGDSVSAGVFGSEQRWRQPRKGMSAFGSIMNALYDVQSSAAASSPFSALEAALSRLKRRTFIIMISNFRKEDEEQISWILPRIARRHLLLMASLREIDAEKLAARRPRNGMQFASDEILESTAAYAYLREREALYKKWEHSGILTLESSAGTLSSALINRYLAVKRGGLL